MLVDSLKRTINEHNTITSFRRILGKYFIKPWQFHVLMLIPFLYFIVFAYIPMYGIIIAFKDFSFVKGIIGSDWIGFKHFNEFFSSFYFFRLVRNTFLIGILSVIFAFPAPIIFAFALNEIRFERFKKISQSISYIPHFLSTVVVIGILYNFLSINDGLVNQLLTKIGIENINFLSSAKWFRALYIGSGIWQGFGFGSILYLAAMTSIDPQLYEALEVDGGNRLHKIVHITFPGIRPVIVMMLILSMGGIFAVGFEKIILMYSPGIYETADVIQTYVYRKGILDGEISFSTAVGLFNTSINFLLLVLFNTMSKKIGEASLW